MGTRGADDFAEIDTFLLGRMAATRLPGLSIVMVRNGGTAYERNFGFRDLETRRSPKTTTFFGLGSVTKVFTALSVMQLQDRGLLSIEDTIDQYVPTPLAGVAEPTRLSDLLTHSSGFPALGFSESKLSPRWPMHGLPIGSHEDLNVFMRGAEEWRCAGPGERWAYLNEGYILLGAVIEQVSGMPYEAFVERNILQPLDMTRTTFDQARVAADEDRAVPYMIGRDGKYFVGANLGGAITSAGGLVSCTRDMARFVAMLLESGAVPGGGRLLSESAFGSATAPQVRMPHVDVPTLFDGREGRTAMSYEQGNAFQVTGNFFGTTVIGHGGGVMGGTSYVAAIPERGLGVAVLANGHGYPLSQVAMYVLAVGLGAKAADLPFLRAEVVLEQLVGDYAAFKDTIAATVEARGDFLELRLRFHNEDRVVTLVPEEVGVGTHRFFTYSGGRRLEATFIRDPAGPVELRYERYSFRKK